METIFIFIPDGFAARYLLRTDIFETLKQSSVRIVILSPNADEEYFLQEFSGPQIIIERLGVDKSDRYFNKSKSQQLLKALRLHTLGGNIRTNEIQREAFLQDMRDRRPLLGQGVELALWSLSRSRLLRRGLVRLESRLFVPHLHRVLFKKYRPRLVITPSTGYWQLDSY
ncbi:MAG: hypothetical protein V3U90_02780, partial [Dehalococcoidia bacterium]